jgi:uncharacterized protein YkwD
MNQPPRWNYLIPAVILAVLLIIIMSLHYIVDGDAQEQLCFKETNQCVHPKFVTFWQSNGLEFGEPNIAYHESVALWGFPLAPATFTTNADGDYVLTQVFERMVFEHHPKNAGTPYEIQLRRMGAEFLKATPTPTPTRTPTPVAINNEAVCLNAEEATFLKLINDYRVANGRVALKVSATLNKAAYAHSLDMAQRNYFSHTTLSPLPAWQAGPTFSDRMKGMGYTYNVARGENIAAGQPTAQRVFDAWKGSAGHNANMLSANYKVIGIGFVKLSGNTYTYYWTNDFGGYVDAAPSCN